MKAFNLIIAVILISAGQSFAQRVSISRTYQTDFSYQLDLQAVASAFSDSRDLEEFERKLNDPYLQISNLDLNRDGYIDYLRVIDSYRGYSHLITIQAVLGRDFYQDVVNIDVERGVRGQIMVQVVGDSYFYGPNYIINPIYVRPPVIFSFFWGNYYRPWVSPYYYGYYPNYYRPMHTCNLTQYQRRMASHMNNNISYQHGNSRKSRTSMELQKSQRRNDFEARNPNTNIAQRSQIQTSSSRSQSNSSSRINSSSQQTNRVVTPQNSNNRVSSANRTGNNNKQTSRATSSTRTTTQNRGSQSNQQVKTYNSTQKTDRTQAKANTKSSESSQRGSGRR